MCRMCGGTPAGPRVNLAESLEDAYRRQVLRAVGSTYQFRHALLQDSTGYGDSRTSQGRRRGLSQFVCGSDSHPPARGGGALSGR